MSIWMHAFIHQNRIHDVSLKNLSISPIINSKAYFLNDAWLNEESGDLVGNWFVSRFCYPQKPIRLFFYKLASR